MPLADCVRVNSRSCAISERESDRALSRCLQHWDEAHRPQSTVPAHPTQRPFTTRPSDSKTPSNNPCASQIHRSLLSPQKKQKQRIQNKGQAPHLVDLLSRQVGVLRPSTVELRQLAPVSATQGRGPTSAHIDSCSQCLEGSSRSHRVYRG